MPYCSRFMIGCDYSNNWFHGSCVGIDEYEALHIGAYKCPACSTEHNKTPFYIEGKYTLFLFVVLIVII